MTPFPLPPFAVIGWTVLLAALIVGGIAWLVRDERRQARRLAADVQAVGGSPEEAAALLSLAHRPLCSLCHDDGELLVATAAGAILRPCSCEHGDLMVMARFDPVTAAGRELRRRRTA